MSVPATGKIREAIQVLCSNPGDQFSYGVLFELFGLETAADKAVLRSKMRDMRRRGEIQRVRPGVFTYHPEAVERREAVGYQRVWRAMRSARPGWTMADMAQVTRMSYSMVRKYGNCLHAEGFIAPNGRQVNTRLWRITAKGREHRETPYPPRAIKDPYANERSAACRLVRLLMDQDPGRPGVREKIVKETRAIQARFTGDE